KSSTNCSGSRPSIRYWISSAAWCMSHSAARSRPSGCINGGQVLLNTLATERILDRLIGQKVDLLAKNGLKLINEVDKTPEVWLLAVKERCHQVDIAVGPRVPTRLRAEQAQLADVPALG